MSEQNFYLELVSKMTVKLGPEEEIQLDTNVIKNNGVVRKAVTIGKNGSSVRPTIYLENYYAKYKDGLPMDIIIDKIIEIYHGAIKEAGESVVDFVKDWERVKDKIVFYLVSKERNKGNLDKHIYEDFCDLAAITVVHVTSGEKDIGSLHVTPEMLKCWGVSKAEVLEKAHVNTERLFPAECFSITKMIMSMLGEEVAEVIGRTPCPVDLSILSNKTGVMGATVIMYEDFMKGIYQELQGKFIILPSSIHEVVIIPWEEGIDLENQRKMVSQINSEHIRDDEILSDNVYLYDGEKVVLVCGAEGVCSYEKGERD